MKLCLSLVRLTAFLILTSSFLLSADGASATWNLNPTSSDWNTATNWTPATVPNGSADVATFGSSNIATVNVSTAITVDSVVFSPGAVSYSITPSSGTI